MCRRRWWSPAAVPDVKTRRRSGSNDSASTFPLAHFGAPLRLCLGLPRLPRQAHTLSCLSAPRDSPTRTRTMHVPEPHRHAVVVHDATPSDRGLEIIHGKRRWGSRARLTPTIPVHFPACHEDRGQHLRKQADRLEIEDRIPPGRWMPRRHRRRLVVQDSQRQCSFHPCPDEYSRHALPSSSAHGLNGHG
nr:hypothetical protein CFP56_32297 [Quercus suber]